jgi:hypothetical protein
VTFLPIPLSLILKDMSGGVTHRKGYLRKALMVLQFAFTVTLIIASAVICSQLDFIKNKDLGYDKDNIIYFLRVVDFSLSKFTDTANRFFYH